MDVSGPQPHPAICPWFAPLQPIDFLVFILICQIYSNLKTFAFVVHLPGTFFPQVVAWPIQSLHLDFC